MPIDAFASLAHYRAHLLPVWNALPEGVRGTFHEGIPTPADRPCIVASYTDHRAARRAGYTQFVVMEHGAGQSYSDTHPAYPGGRDRGDADLFLVPNEHAATRWRDAYPSAAVEVIGSPRLDGLPVREPGPPTVAISFHTPWTYIAPEAGSAFGHFRGALPDLARSVNLIGHGHPRANYGPAYRKLGIEFVADFDEVCRRADLYICDNSSTLFEFASTGRPVIVLDDPAYRPDAHHGLRFWEAADVGVRIAQPGDLAAAVAFALADPPVVRAAREAALDIVYAHRSGAAERAAAAIVYWLRGAAAVAA